MERFKKLLQDNKIFYSETSHKVATEVSKINNMDVLFSGWINVTNILQQHAIMDFVRSITSSYFTLVPYHFYTHVTLYTYVKSGMIYYSGDHINNTNKHFLNVK